MSSRNQICLILLGLSLLGIGCGGGGGGSSTVATGDPSSGAVVPSLVALQLSPANSAIANGTTVQFTAQGIYSNGAIQDLTTAANFTVSDPTVASATAQGLVTSLRPGAVSVSATTSGRTASTTLTVTGATLTSISLAPATLTLAAGTQEQLRVSASFSDGSRQDLTSAAAWTSSDSSRASVSNLGLVTAAHAGSVNITAAYGGRQARSAVTVTSATLTALTLSQPSPAIASGTSQQLTVVGTFSDGTTQVVTGSASYTTSNSSVATVTAAGNVTGVTPGTTFVQATLLGVTGSAPLTVTSAGLSSLTVSPATVTLAKGTATQLRVRAGFTDSSTQDLTSSAAWTSSNPTLATVSNLGFVTATNVGSVNVTALYGGLTSTSTVVVTSATLQSLAVAVRNSAIASGTSESAAVTGTFSDGSTQDLTSAVTYTSSNVSVATVSSAGILSGHAPGATSLRATLLGVSATIPLTITSAQLANLSLSPTSLTLASGTSGQLHLSGNFSDGTQQDLTSAAVWTTTNSTVATVTPLGLVTSVGVGASNVTATFGGFQVQGSLSVTAARLASVSISPPSAALTQGSALQLSFIGAFSDGTSQDLTSLVYWTSSNTSLGTVNAQGLLTATNVGANTGGMSVSATYGGLMAAAPVSINYFLTPAQQLTGCISNLRNIASAVELYATDNSGQYPDSMAKLTPNFLFSIPLCPGAGADTYSSTFQSSGMTPDAYTFYCSGLHHGLAGIPSDYPQYASLLGVTQSPGVVLTPTIPTLQLATCQRNIGIIIGAIMQYISVNGRPPTTMSQLVPDYIEKIPNCPAAVADTYSAGYQAATSYPFSYSFCCTGLHHAGAGLPANTPSYSSVTGYQP